MLDSIPGDPSSAAERPVEQVVVTFFDCRASPSAQRTAPSTLPYAICAMRSACSSPRSSGAFARTLNYGRGCGPFG